MRDFNDKSTAELFPIDIIPEKKELRSTAILQTQIKDGKLKIAAEANTNITSMTQLKPAVWAEALAMLLLELFETTDENGEIDFDYYTADNFLIAAKNIKQRQISDARELANASSANVVRINTGMTDLANGNPVFKEAKA